MCVVNAAVDLYDLNIEDITFETVINDVCVFPVFLCGALTENLLTIKSCHSIDCKMFCEIQMQIILHKRGVES